LKDRLTYSGGGLDFLGFDDGTRNVPSIIPENVRVSSSNFTDAQLQEMGRSFQGDWGPTRSSLPVNAGLSVSFGDDYDLGDERRAGFIASATYSSELSVQSDVVERVFNAAGAIEPEADYGGEVADHSVALGGLLNLTYQPRATDQVKRTRTSRTSGSSSWSSP
jgi:hypothetical protein